MVEATLTAKRRRPEPIRSQAPPPQATPLDDTLRALSAQIPARLSPRTLHTVQSLYERLKQQPISDCATPTQATPTTAQQARLVLGLMAQGGAATPTRAPPLAQPISERELREAGRWWAAARQFLASAAAKQVMLTGEERAGPPTLATPTRAGQPANQAAATPAQTLRSVLEATMGRVREVRC